VPEKEVWLNCLKKTTPIYSSLASRGLLEIPDKEKPMVKSIFLSAKRSSMRKYTMDNLLSSARSMKISMEPIKTKFNKFWMKERCAFWISTYKEPKK